MNNKRFAKRAVELGSGGKELYVQTVYHLEVKFADDLTLILKRFHWHFELPILKQLTAIEFIYREATLFFFLFISKPRSASKCWKLLKVQSDRLYKLIMRLQTEKASLHKRHALHCMSAGVGL